MLKFFLAIARVVKTRRAVMECMEIALGGTTSSVGTGLGFYICMEIANKLNGDLHVESTLGVGTTMTITIPELEQHA